MTVEAEAKPDAVRIMFDSDDPSGIPLNPAPALVAWYPYSWKGDIARFGPETTIIAIDNDGDQPSCGVLDIETGAATVAELRAWVGEHNKLYPDGENIPTVYCDQSTLPAVAKVVSRYNLDVDLWVADWTGDAHIYQGDTLGMHLVATQYQSPTTHPPSPGHYDTSVVSDPAWHARKPAPAPEPAPEPVPEPGPSYVPGIVTYIANGSLAQSRVESADGKTWTVL